MILAIRLYNIRETLLRYKIEYIGIEKLTQVN